MSEDDFDAVKQVKFRLSLAVVAGDGVKLSDVAVDKIAPILPDRRRLLAEEIKVTASIKAAGKSFADGVSSKLTAKRINSELMKNGMPNATMLRLPEVSDPAAATSTGVTLLSSIWLTLALAAITTVH
jgi:hypothetical protein